MDKRINQKIIEYTKLVKNIMSIKMVILYGSYAKGIEKETSDIDLAVVVEDLKGDYLELSALLFSLVKNIDIKIEPVLISEKNDKSGFLESILKYGKIFY